MYSKPLVSVLVPAYNAELFIADTLQSVLNQTYKNIEVLVVDDGSRDATARIVEKFARRDNRIKLYHQENKGVAAARNFAISKASGEYLAPIDSDDIWYPCKIEKQVTRLERLGPDTAVAYSWSVSIDEKGQVLDAGPMWDLEGEVYQALVLRNFIGNASVPMFRRSAVQMVGGYKEELRALNAQGCEDWEICLRLAERFRYCVAKDYLVGYRCYAQSMSYNHEAMGRSYDLVMQELKSRHPEIPSHIYRWSRSIFYLYLTHKSNVAGDLDSSLKWLWLAIRSDPFVLLVPWVARCLASRMVRRAMFAITHDERARKLNRPTFHPSHNLTYEEAIAEHQGREGRTLWERIQIARWAEVTHYRSFSCC